MSTLSKLLTIAVIVGIDAAIQQNQQAAAHSAAQQEADKWLRRQQIGLKVIEEAIAKDHSRNFVSASSKESTASSLRAELIEACNKRRDILASGVETSIEKFDRTGMR